DAAGHGDRAPGHRAPQHRQHPRPAGPRAQRHRQPQRRHRRHHLPARAEHQRHAGADVHRRRPLPRPQHAAVHADQPDRDRTGRGGARPGFVALRQRRAGRPDQLRHQARPWQPGAAVQPERRRSLGHVPQQRPRRAEQRGGGRRGRWLRPARLRHRPPRQQLRQRHGRR
ncbi:hypothetical protein OY671_010908, partial [Metschnikowia pulcherrima]